MSGHNTGAVLEGRTTRRGTSNANERGNNRDRRRRREYLVRTYRADVDLLIDLTLDFDGLPPAPREVPLGDGEPCCRCYRCGALLTVATVTVDRRVPGVEGGDYSRSNIRPACGTCNSVTGGSLPAQRRAS